ncbi:hypothetical protein [Methylobacterium sp. CM6247]
MTPPSLTNPNPKREAKLTLEQAYDAGFQASGEGWNGEYPERDWQADLAYLKHRSDALAALSAASARPSPADPVRAALAPFVTHYQPWMDDWADDALCTVFARVTFGDLRRARAAINAPTSPSKSSGEEA